MAVCSQHKGQKPPLVPCQRGKDTAKQIAKSEETAMDTFAMIARRALDKDPAFVVHPLFPGSKVTALKKEEDSPTGRGGYNAALRTDKISDFVDNRTLQTSCIVNAEKTHFNVGIAFEKDSKIVVVDVDTPAALDKIKNTPLLRDAFKDTYCVFTPRRKGFHFYFRVAWDVTQGSGKYQPGERR